MAARLNPATAIQNRTACARGRGATALQPADVFGEAPGPDRALVTILLAGYTGSVRPFPTDEGGE